MNCRLLTSSLVVLLMTAPSATAQIELAPVFSFVDTTNGGNGAIGVTQDEVSGQYHVIDFSNTMTVHQFDPQGNFQSEFGTSSCSPSAPSPNDITYDPDTDSLWVVDNNGNTVTNISRTGACLGGFSFTAGLGHALGITYHRGSQTLFVSGLNSVLEFDKAGTPLGGFSFTPNGGSQLLTGITVHTGTGNFLIVQAGGDRMFEVTPTGDYVSHTNLAMFGIQETQGIHYNPVDETIMIIDGNLSRVFVFVADCVRAKNIGIACKGSGNYTPDLYVSGCSKLGQLVTIDLIEGLGGAPALMFVGTATTSVPFGGGCSLWVAPPQVAIPFTLDGAGAGDGTFKLVAPIPLQAPLVNIYLQAFVADPGNPTGIAATGGIRMLIQSP